MRDVIGGADLFGMASVPPWSGNCSELLASTNGVL